MTVITHTERRRMSAWQFVSRALQATAVAAIAYLIVSVILFADWAALVETYRQAAWALVCASALYLLGHVVRAFRLALLIGGWRVGLRDIVGFHFMTAATSLAAPFKLGEVYRMVEMANVAGGGVRGVVVAWWERLLDALFMLGLVVVMRLQAGPVAEHTAIIGAILLFIGLSAAVFWVLPENISRAQVLIIRRYSAPMTVHVLNLLEQTRRAIESAPWVVRRKAASLGVLTVLVWSCEIGAFLLIAGAAEGGVGAGVNALLAFLSSLLRGVTLLGAVGEAQDAGLTLYLLATHGVLAIVGVVAALHYVRRRPLQHLLDRNGAGQGSAT
jgi:hypothetical protein